MNASDPFLQFMDNGYDSIEGWPGQKGSVNFMKIFRELFVNFQNMGGACEIGVHHGKYLIALHNLLGGNETSLGIDLFDQQYKNIDGSGRGSLEICKNNILKYAANPHLIELLSQDSITMKQNQINKVCSDYTPFSIVSIDGGHTPLHVVRDFMFASQCVSEHGIIAVDDIFHPDWPGVTEGMYTLLSQRQSPFVPFFLTRKKIFCCSASVQALYYNFLDQRCAGGKKEIEFCGWKMLSLNFGGEYQTN